MPAFINAYPGNVLLAPGFPIAIDWTNASAGNPAADVARTCLMFRSPFIPPEMPKLMVPLIPLIKKIFLASYLKRYMMLTGTSAAEVEQWMPPVAAARLRENIPGEREWLLSLVRTN